MTPTQINHYLADLIDDGTADGRNMLWRRKRWSRRWDSFLTVSGVLAALAMACGVFGGCAWILWEVFISVASLISSIFN